MKRHSRRPQPVVGFRPTAGAARAKERVATKASGKTRDWYKITNSGRTADIAVYDSIGEWGITAADFLADLKALGSITQVNLHVSSMGGEVFEAIAIYNGLRRHPATVTTYVDSVAASAASVIAMAGDRVLIEPTATIMIHDAMVVAAGNAADMRETADLLDRVSGTIASIYASAAGGAVSAWRTAMKAETWYSAEEAVASGLADEVLPGSAPRVAATADREWQRTFAALLTENQGSQHWLSDLLTKGKK